MITNPLASPHTSKIHSSDFVFDMQGQFRYPGGTVPYSEEVVAGVAVSSTIKGSLALPTAAVQRLITHPLSGLHGSFFRG